MKKLLLFIVVLFASVCTMSFADPCSTAICQCIGGPNITFGQYCPSKNTYTPSASTYTPKQWGAIAVDADLRKNGWSWGFETEEEASSGAEADCRKMGGKNCVVVMTYADKQYASMAVSNTGAYGVSRRLKKAEADKNALKECRKYAKDCYLYITVNAEDGLIK